jgi:hypothetical protein
MDTDSASSALSRRDLLRMIGATAGGAAMYQALSTLGFAADSPYRGPIDLQGAPRGASGLVLGAGMAGMMAFGLASDGIGPMRAVHLSDAQVADVVNYVRNNFGNRYKSKITAQQVAALAHPAAAPPP